MVFNIQLSTYYPKTVSINFQQYVNNNIDIYFANLCHDFNSYKGGKKDEYY